MSKFASKNATTKRTPEYDLDEYPTTKNILNTSKNQHTTAAWNIEFDKTYWNLLNKTTESDALNNKFTCWILSEQKGIDPSGFLFFFLILNYLGAYFRMTFNGEKLLAHVFTWSYHHPKEKPIRVSHICGRASCCRPSHLHSETMNINNSRSGCIGFVQRKNKFFLVCKHQPSCLRITIVKSSMKVDDPR
jgi:Zinc-binding loop region of homing endonuclease